MKPTPEQIKQIAIECGAWIDESSSDYTQFDGEEMQAFFTRAYELGWKNRGESDAQSDKEETKCHECGGVNGWHLRKCSGYLVDEETGAPIRNNTGE